MSDLGDMVRLFESFGIEHEVKSAWSGKNHIKVLDVPDPAGPMGPKKYGTEYRFGPVDNEFLGMNMYYEYVVDSPTGQNGCPAAPGAICCGAIELCTAEMKES